MKEAATKSVILGNVEAVQQGMRLIQSLTDEQYQYVAAPYVSSSIGQHFRHLIDLFCAVEQVLTKA